MISDWDEIFNRYHDHHHDHKHQQISAIIQNKHMKRQKRRSQNPNQQKHFATGIIGIDSILFLQELVKESK